MTLTNKLLVIKICSILKKAQRIQPTLYDGSVIAKEHVVTSVTDDEETLILEEESRSKMLDKQNDPISIEKKIKISPIDYSKLNKIKEDFGKRFVTQKELSAEQAFWLKHPSFSETPVMSCTPVRIEAPSELPKRTTSDAITAGAWGFEHTKAYFVTEIIPLLKVLKDTFNAFDRTLLDEITEVQTVFNQMKAAVDHCYVDKNVFEIQIKHLSIDNDQLLKPIMYQEIMHIAMNSVDILDVKKSYVNECNKCLELETELLKKKDLIEKDVYDKLLKRYSTLEKHCSSLELTTQLNQEDTVIRKLKDRIKSLSGKDSLEKVKKDIDEIETISIELEHTLKNELKKLKGKNVVDTAVSKPNATIAPGIFKLDIEPIFPRLKNNRDAHEVYIEKSIENTDTLRGFVKRARTQNPSEPLLESACIFTKHVQELLVYVSQTCPDLPKPSEKLVAVTPMNKDKRVRFAEPVTSLSNIPKQTDSLKTKDSNKPLLTSTGVKPTTSASGSKPSGNTKNNRISYPLTRITLNKIVPPKETTSASVATPTSGILFYSRRPKATRSVGSSSKVKIVESKTSNPKEPKQSWGSTVSDVPSSSLNDCRFGNDHIAKIMVYGDYLIGNITISRVYDVEGLGHNLFFMGQFCDSDLEVAFCKHTYFIRDLNGVDLLKGSRGSNLYTLSMDNLLPSSPICLLSKASKTKSCLWHRRLSHLNFDYITSLAKQGLVRGLPKLKYQKDHLCSACALGKSKKHSHKPKDEESIQEKLYLLHMDLCGTMRVQSINGRKCILVIVDDFSQFTWVKFLRSKDEVPEFTKKAFEIYNKRTRMIIETIHVDFDELTTMASEQFIIAPEPAILTGTPSSTTIDQEAPSTSTSQTPPENSIPRLQISQSPRGIFLNQSKYALESIKKYGMETCEPTDTPMVEKSKMDKDPQGKAVDPTRYR
ncbi:retrovirus-related pol polyprotein from transposon TNT 1-94 [Tanacetum coccineum]